MIIELDGWGQEGRSLGIVLIADRLKSFDDNANIIILSIAYSFIEKRIGVSLSTLRRRR